MDFASHVSQAWASVGQAKDTLRKIQRDGSGEPPDLARLAQVARALARAMDQVGHAELNRPEENKEAS
jgi:hypothetical protein